MDQMDLANPAGRTVLTQGWFCSELPLHVTHLSHMKQVYLFIRAVNDMLHIHYCLCSFQFAFNICMFFKMITETHQQEAFSFNILKRPHLCLLWLYIRNQNCPFHKIGMNYTL